MNGFSILMFIFAVCVLLVGLYAYTGHEIKYLAWRAQFKGLNIDGWKNVGKWTMVSSIFIFAIAILAIFIV